MPDPIRTRTSQHTPPPPFNTATEQTRRGTNIHKRRTLISDGGVSVTPPALPLTMPPTTTTHAPPSTTAPPTTTTRGGKTEDTPLHEQHRHTLTTHTPHTWRGTVHDMTAVLTTHCSGMSRARATPLHWAGQQQHTTAIPHTEEDGHHPLIILSHCSRSHNQRTIMINVQ